jgi:hypothetical protein
MRWWLSGFVRFQRVDKNARLMKALPKPKRTATKPPVFKFFKLSAPNSKPLTELGLEFAITIAIKKAGGNR